MDPVPISQGSYFVASRFGDLVVTAGMTPRREGVLQYEGKLSPDTAPEAYQPAVELAAANALAAAREMLVKGERIVGILKSTVFLATEGDFVAHSRVADFASRVFAQEVGPSGIGARAAVGVATLPGGAPVEIQIYAVVARGDRHHRSR